MTASLEPLPENAAVLRVHEGLLGGFRWCCVVVPEDGGETAYIAAAQRWPDGDERRAGEAALRAAGFRRRRFVLADGRERVVEL